MWPKQGTWNLCRLPLLTSLAEKLTTAMADLAQIVFGLREAVVRRTFHNRMLPPLMFMLVRRFVQVPVVPPETGGRHWWNPYTPIAPQSFR